MSYSYLRAGLIALTALLAAALTVSVISSCGSRTLTSSLSDAAEDALRTSVSGLEAPVTPPEGYAIVKRDGPYWGPYRLPEGRMVYTADTIREYYLEGIVEPGVYGPGDPDPLAALTATSHGAKAASAPPNMDHDGLASPTTGNVRTLVLKVKWSGHTGGIAQTSFVEDKYFDTEADNNVSVKEYYEQQSYGQLTFTGEVYPTGEDAAYEISGINEGTPGFIQLSKAQAKQLLTLADADVDFSQYDADGNGYIDSLHLVFQRLTSGPTREHVGSICKHVIYSYEIGDFTKDGVKVLRAAYIDFYSICYEDDGDYKYNRRDYTPHHEHGHILGLPDLYDYGGDYTGRDNPGPDDDESKGCGFWAVMAGGGYTMPVQNICAPHKYCLGWTDAQMVTENLKDYRLASVLNSPDNILRVWKDGAEEQEYFVLENNATTDRHYIWYDPPTYNYYPSPSDIYPSQMNLLDLNPGLLIWHVDERVWYKEYIFEDVGKWGFGCNDHEERKFIDLEESTATYMLPYGDGDVIDDEGYWGGKYDPWPATYDSTTYDRFGPDTTPDSDAYEDFPGTGSSETGIIIGGIERDGNDILLDISIGAPYVHFPSPVPFVLSGTATIEPDEIENTEELEYFVNGESFAVFTEAPWGIELDTTGIEYGTIDVRVEARGVVPELFSQQDFTYVVDNTSGQFPLTVLFENEEDILAAWASDSAGAFARHEEGYESGHSFGVHSSEPPDYPGNLTAIAVLPLISLPDSPEPTMTVQMHYNLEDGADVASVVISTDYFDEDWTELDLRSGDDAVFTGYQEGWTSGHISVAPWAGQSVHIGFLLETDSDGVGEDGEQPAGWWLDQIVVATNWAESIPSIVSTGLPDPARVGLVFNRPELSLDVGTANGATTLEYSLHTAGGPISGEISGPPFVEDIDVSSLPNQYALLKLQVFDDMDVGSPHVEVPVWIYNLRADIDGDGLVGIGDRDALEGLLGMTSADPLFFPWYDTNGDGAIDEQDLAAVGYFWSGS